jgi:hypothetical protein
VLYIGKGGTITTSGTFKNQDVPNRLKASRGNVSSDTWFADLCRGDGPLLVEYVFLRSIPQCPALLESQLLQEHLNHYGRLPVANKSF